MIYYSCTDSGAALCKPKSFLELQPIQPWPRRGLRPNGNRLAQIPSAAKAKAARASERQALCQPFFRPLAEQFFVGPRWPKPRVMQRTLDIVKNHPKSKGSQGDKKWDTDGYKRFRILALFLETQESPCNSVIGKLALLPSAQRSKDASVSYSLLLLGLRGSCSVLQSPVLFCVALRIDSFIHWCPMLSRLF